MVLARGDALCRCRRLRLGDGEAVNDETTDDGTIAEGRQIRQLKKYVIALFRLSHNFRSHENKITKK